jgi:chromosome segregation ATPase
MFADMKRIFLLTTLFSLLLPAVLPAAGQETTAAARAAAIAEKQEMEERYKQISSDVQGLTTGQAALQRKVSALESEIRSLRDEIARLQQSAGVKYASQDDLQRLVKAVQDADQKRLKDNQELRQAIETIGRNVATAPVTPAPRAPRPTPAVPANPPDGAAPVVKGFEHVVQKGEFLSTIISAYNEKLKESGAKERITLKMVEDANPGLKPNSMRVGQKIVLPDPREKQP